MKSVSRRSFVDLLICLALAAIIVGIYSQALNFEFIHYDDNDYVFDNSAVQKGLTRENLIWAFATSHASNWHPITWLSHMTDVSLFGMESGLHHLTNLLFHILNSLLMFLVFRIMTGKIWQSAFVAALFAIHPLHVQSVAWVSERKDVLSTFFWLLTMGAYFRYVQKPGILRYLPLSLFLALGLMSKPMLVTLPVVLLLLDYWPLNRMQGDQPAGKNSQLLPSIRNPLILEKIPLLTLVLLSAAITFWVQHQAGSVKSLDVIPLVNRLVNVPVAYMHYVIKMISPVHLVFFYPYPALDSQIPLFFAALVVIIAVSCFVLRYKSSHPYLMVGWLWYMVTLLPVIGIVQVGMQSMADRYTYIPLTGLFIMAAWGIPELFPSRLRFKKILIGGLAGLVLCGFSVFAWRQAGTWKNSIALFTHAIQTTPNNAVAHYNLGYVLSEKKDKANAIVHYQKSLEISSLQPDAHASLGMLLLEQNPESEKGFFHLKTALQLEPENNTALYNLGTALLNQEKISEAISYLQKSVKSDPENEKAHFNLGKALFRKGDYDLAVFHLKKTIALNPDHGKAHLMLGGIFLGKKDWENADKHLKKAITANPESVLAHYYAGLLALQKQNPALAAEHFTTVLALNPESMDAHYQLAAIYAESGRYEVALAHIRSAVELQPENPLHYYNVACMYARQNRVDDAVQWLKTAMAKGYSNLEQIRTDPDLSPLRDTEFFKNTFARP